MDGSFASSAPLAPGETRVDFKQGPAALSVLVPTYRDAPARMIAALAGLPGSADTHMILFDDGSGRELEAECAALEGWPGPASLIVSDANLGRAGARNRLLAHAGTDWVLLLDADMLPDRVDFLQRYLDAIAAADGPMLTAGGFSLEQVEIGPETRLHAAQSERSECLAAAVRAEQPGRYVFTSNILVHREVLAAVGFDEAFTGWGWEDVDWGLRVAARYPVVHIDNTATHLGLDMDVALMRKYGGSGENFARIIERHPEAADEMNLMRAVRLIQRIGPARLLVRWIAGGVARTRFLPTGLRLFGLKTWRAAVYSKHVRPC